MNFSKSEQQDFRILTGLVGEIKKIRAIFLSPLSLTEILRGVKFNVDFVRCVSLEIEEHFEPFLFSLAEEVRFSSSLFFPKARLVCLAGHLPMQFSLQHLSLLED